MEKKKELFNERNGMSTKKLVPLDIMFTDKEELQYIRTGDIVTLISDGRSIPVNPWPQKFYITEQLFEAHLIKIRPLTLMGLMKGIFENFITMNWWRIKYILFLIGFMDCPAGENLNFKKHFGINFISTLKKRKVENKLYSFDYNEYLAKIIEGNNKKS